MVSRNRCRRVVGSLVFQRLFTSERCLRVPRGLWLFGVVMLLAAFGLIGKTEYDAMTRNAAATAQMESFQITDFDHDWSGNTPFAIQMQRVLDKFRTERFTDIPNAGHVWWASAGELFQHPKNNKLLSFGHDYIKTAGDWSALCAMDSNEDGITNGQHLGDPCCHWRWDDRKFNLQARREYRRWQLSHPSEHLPRSLRNQKTLKRVEDLPGDCSESYNVTKYNEQFSTFYFHKAHNRHEPKDLSPVKIGCLIVMAAIFAHWVIWKGLLTDVLPLVTSSKPLPVRVRIAICVASFLYMDLTSGVIHLILDYAPFDLPGLGMLARGFQYHHEDPTAIIRISWFEYVSHIHFLCPLIQVAVLLSDASRLQRLFWFWGGAWAHLFQTAHRWAHMPPEFLPWIVRFLQKSGVLLNHEQHMYHHEDLEHQFTILSGHTDVILDNLSIIVPPARYDIWFLFGVFWFLIPIFADSICRDFILELEDRKLESGLDKLGRNV